MQIKTILIFFMILLVSAIVHAQKKRLCPSVKTLIENYLRLEITGFRSLEAKNRCFKTKARRMKRYYEVESMVPDPADDPTSTATHILEKVDSLEIAEDMNGKPKIMRRKPPLDSHVIAEIILYKRSTGEQVKDTIEFIDFSKSPLSATKGCLSPFKFPDNFYIKRSCYLDRQTSSTKNKKRRFKKRKPRKKKN